MNGSAKLSTTTDKVWKSKTDITTRYEKCVNCSEFVLDNWYLRHVKKCVENHAMAVELYVKATENHRQFKLELQNASATAPTEILDAKTESLKNGYLATHKALAEEKKDPTIYTPELDDKLTQQTPSDKRILNNFQKYTFKFGDIVDAEVTSIESYGVHVNNINGNIEKLGLIKISKARNSTVTDLKAHFRVGDKIRAEVLEIRVDGKLGLSTRKSVLPNYPVKTTSYTSSNMAEKLEPIKEQIMVKAETIQKDDQQLEDILTFVKGKIGIVSPEAKTKIKTLLETKGMFTFMMSLAKVADFQIDVGLMFAAEIERQMGNRP